MLYSASMRRVGIAVWPLLILLVAVPTLRHASSPELTGTSTSETTLKHAPRSAPAIARTAATAAVAVVVGLTTPPVGAVEVSPTPRRASPHLAYVLLTPLRL